MKRHCTRWVIFGDGEACTIKIPTIRFIALKIMQKAISDSRKNVAGPFIAGSTSFHSIS